MDLLLDLAKNIYYNIDLLTDLNPEQKFETVLETYADFTKAYPLVIKYMCHFNLYNPDLFKELLTKQKETRPTYEQGYELQGLYIKKLLIQG